MRSFEAVGVIILATAVSIGYFLVVQVRAEGPETPQKPPILLLQASQDNSRIEQTVTADKAALCLQFKFESSANHSVTIRVTEFTAEDAPLKPLIPTLSAGSCSGIDLQGLARVPSNPPTPAGSAPNQVDSRTDKELTVTVTPDKPIVELHFKNVRPKTTYKGKLYLFSRDKSRSWDIIVKSGELPVLVVDKIAPQQLTIYNPFASDKSRPQFPIMLRTKSGDGPYTNVRVRVEDPNKAKSSVITSNFTTDALSFWKKKDCFTKECTPLNLWSSDKGTNDDTLTIDEGSQETIWVQVESLGPGEYSPVLRFMADGASEIAEESKLALILQIRHHWFLPGLVILLGSIAGWIGSKYFAADRTARRLRGEVSALSNSAAFLAREDPHAGGWHFPSEAHSYALARVRVILHQVEYLTKKVLVVYAAEQEISDRSADARRRLGALEALQATRRAVQQWANERPAVQQAIGRTLRQVLNLLDRPAFGDAQKKAADDALNAVNAWLDTALRQTLYRNAVLVRLNELNTVDPAQAPEGRPRNLITELQGQMPTREDLTQHDISKLTEDDRKITCLWLLWRDRRMAWVKNLTASVNDHTPPEDLYRLADLDIWELLKTAAQNKQIRLEQVSGREQEETFDLVEVRLRLDAEDLAESRLVYHPCVIRWLVTPRGGSPRTIETDRLTLVQYFPEPGHVTVEAWLMWKDKKIPVPTKVEFDVRANREYGTGHAVFKGGIIELVAVTPLAMLFAILTGLQTQYDATFGSLGQYMNLFLWASGASTGGNLFKQLGTSRTAGGQESTLPSK